VFIHNLLASIPDITIGGAAAIIPMVDTAKEAVKIMSVEAGSCKSCMAFKSSSRR
jgi:hypothetical protein